MDRNTDQQTNDPHDAVLRAVESNGEMLLQLLEQVQELENRSRDDGAKQELSAPVDAETADDIEWLRERLDDSESRVEEYMQRVVELEQQNQDLASRVANSNVQRTVNAGDSGSNEALSWEQRKQLILEQMESDSFDAESFVGGVDSPADTSSDEEPIAPADFVEQLHAELNRKSEELDSRESEIRELRCLLDEQSGARGDGMAIGAAAIAELVDQDELVLQERERLQLLREEWEEKFRQGEIEASLERAKLSRERLELARKNSELEDQLEHLRRESRPDEGGSSRRWLAKLGLSDTGE